ncbi:MAG TPA: flagellar motor switch protein FliN [Sulfurihydrogenibium sp.]|uniref:flagellar motor switch protein FliN n=1 Tax=Sulfurihydrogenibium sp. (strain YO3AOP1) TaxID=436114 RepID=UPI0001750BBE|nr:flagellar motor switch protein FliN [Sulfurihydrogenibium sp. YO3AOP1]ACD67256.1 flagellar motor switch protein FliN [Sulfurihydrogenibium sp. YO3AOP1]HBT98589.1 flagellar motor switch protein FliN [Sulfurihydrogenibium sp.]
MEEMDKQENKPEDNQEDLAAAWSEMLNQDEKKEESQEDLLAQWSEMLNESGKKEGSQEDLAAQWSEMLHEEKSESVDANTHQTPLKESEKKESFTKEEFSPEILNKLDILLDIPITITVEVGSKSMSIEEILKLAPSSVIDLDKYLNEPIDLKVNGVLVAKGELYQVDDNFAIKITEILTKEERVRLVSSQIRG